MIIYVKKKVNGFRQTYLLPSFLSFFLSSKVVYRNAFCRKKFTQIVFLVKFSVGGQIQETIVYGIKTKFKAKTVKSFSKNVMKYFVFYRILCQNVFLE